MVPCVVDSLIVRQEILWIDLYAFEQHSITAQSSTLLVSITLVATPFLPLAASVFPELTLSLMG